MIAKIWTGTLLFLAWMFFCAWLVLVCRENNVNPLRGFARFFKKQSKGGRIVFCAFFIVTWVIASNKPNGGGNGGNLRGSLPSGEITITSTNTTRTITAEDVDRGFVMSHVGTDEAFDFTPPSNAVVCDDWRAFGAATDWIYESVNWKVESGRWGTGNGELGTGNGEWGTGNETKLRIYSDGCVEVKGGPVFSPFKAVLGIVPEANWYLLTTNYQLSTTNYPSQFWHFVTPSNTLQITWQNVLYGRDTNTPVSVQAEFWTDGRFTYRYDLSRCGGRGATALPEDIITNVVVGASFGGNGWATNAIPTNVTSMVFYPLAEDDAYNQDPDNDGLLTIDELFFYYTDPRNPDTDYDGLTDYEELFIYNTNPLNPHSVSDTYCDGIAVKIGDVNPFSYPEGSTNTVIEHVFYSGTTNGVFSYPQSSDSMAVLQVSVAGSGTGDLIVGNHVVPLVAPPQMRSFPPNPMPPLLVQLVKGETYPVYVRGDELLQVSLNSADFAFGVLPTHNSFGHINFPNTVATTPCIHDFNARRKGVYLPMSRDAEALSATWSGSADVSVSNIPPRSAAVTGNFSARSTSGITYTLTHPQYLFGQTTYNQTVRFCPRPPDPDPEDPDPPEDPPWCQEGEGDDSDENDDCYDEHWCCYWGACDGWCGCGCDCGSGSGDPLPGEGDLDDECPIHHMPYEDCAHYHDDEYTNAVQNVQHLGGVLYIRDPPFYEQIHLDVSTEHRNCCTCPDHWTNYVGVAYKSYRLRLIDSNGLPFRLTETSCDVNLAGVHPSSAVGDATLAFSRNGEIYQQHNKTVLGVAIKGDYGVDLANYNALNSSFGYPMTVCTNLWNAPQMRLVTNVKLPNGNVHLELVGATGQFTVWYYDYYSWSYRKLLDSSSTRVKNLSMEYWKAIMRRSGDVSSAELPIYITSSTPGTVGLKFRYWNVIDGKFVQDEATQYITSVKPSLLVDYNRDGKIDALDVVAALAGRYAYFWVNDDRWKYDDAFDTAWMNSVNSANGMIDGRNDLINFLPIAVDITPFASHWNSGSVYYRIEANSSALRNAKLVFADIAQSQIGDTPFGNDMDINGNSVYEAPVFALGGGTNLPPAFVSLSQSGSSTLLMEFPEVARCHDLYLNIYSKSDNELLFSASLKLHVGEVSNMLGWENLRNAAGGSDGMPTRLATDDWPTSEHEPGNVVFVHGYNMAEDAETPLWAKNVFKKLWWAGLDRGFIAVQWRGNEGQYYQVGYGWVSPNYYGNVQNAFATAFALKTAMDGVSGPKWFLAHSLGNMLVSAAIQDYQMPHEKYFMLNAAVATEAYDPTNGVTQTSHDDMTPVAWTNYSDRVRATHWFERFPSGDGRRLLTWKGRFANVTNIVNFYSSQEDVVCNGDGTLKPYGRVYSWYNQEYRKGSWAMMLHEYEGGWEFNPYHDTVTGSYVGNEYVEHRERMSPEDAADLTDEQLRQHPFFLDFANTEMHTSSNGLIVATNYLYRAEMLAYAIPSESYAVGANNLLTMDDISPVNKDDPLFGNYNMATLFTDGKNDLPPNGDDFEDKYQDWQHSTFVQRSYKRVHQLFKKITQLMKESQK